MKSMHMIPLECFWQSGTFASQLRSTPAFSIFSSHYQAPSFGMLALTGFWPSGFGGCPAFQGLYSRRRASPRDPELTKTWPHLLCTIWSMDVGDAQLRECVLVWTWALQPMSVHVRLPPAYVSIFSTER